MIFRLLVEEHEIQHDVTSQACMQRFENRRKTFIFLSISKLTYETEPNRVLQKPNRTETEPNRNRGFSSKPFRNRTEFQKTIPHIPSAK